MCTVQKYDATASGATPAPQDQAPGLPETNEEREIRHIKDQLIELVTEYADSVSPIPAINDMAQAWIQGYYIDLSLPDNKHKLRAVLSLTTFLVELRTICDNLAVFTQEQQEEEGAGDE